MQGPAPDRWQASSTAVDSSVTQLSPEVEVREGGAISLYFVQVGRKMGPSLR
jgi:hypothetical protein